MGYSVTLKIYPSVNLVATETTKYRKEYSDSQALFDETCEAAFKLVKGTHLKATIEFYEENSQCRFPQSLLTIESQIPTY